jgi:hypothetical protein
MIPYILSIIGGYLIADSLKNKIFKDGGSVYENLIAPNGKTSFLTPEQYKLVRTPAFMKWSNNWKYVLKDDNGEPIVAYHGTNMEDFTEFSERYIGSRDSGYYGKGFYFVFYPFSPTSAIGEAKYYGSRVIPAFIKTKKIFDISSLSNYNGEKISLIGVEPLIFMINLHKLFPNEEFYGVKKKEYGKRNYDGSVEIISSDVPVKRLVELFGKYENEIKWVDKGDRLLALKDDKRLGSTELIQQNRKSGFYGENLDRAKAIIIAEIIQKEHGIEVDYQPEGIMTRNPKITELIRESGYDSIVQSMDGDEIVVFKPEQIKLADGSNTTFDSNNPDIRYKGGGRTFNDKELLNKWKRGESIGFSSIAHLKAKGLIPRADGTKRKSQ